MLDLVIIGAAAAGCSAAVYASRRNLNFKVVAKDVGGEVALAGEVENWIGIEHISGFELAQTFRKHVESYGVEIEEGYEVTEIQKEKNYHKVIAKNFLGEEKIYETKAVIVASGIHPRELNLPGEQKYKGKGVTYCTVCDGPLYKGKITATIGAGNSALESALMLGGIAEKGYLLTKYDNLPEHKGGFPKGEDILIEKVKKLDNIEIIYNAKTLEILGNNATEKIKYEDTKTGEIKEIDVNGVMVHIGLIPNSDFVSCGEKTKAKEIKVNTRCETNCPGIFAAGDVTDVAYKQISIAAGHGALAALSAIDYINRWKEE